MVTVEFPVRPESVEIVAVWIPPVPPNLTLELGTSFGLEEAAPSLRVPASLSTSESLRGMRPVVSLRHALGLALPARP
jgi:hypothetical protein